MEQRILHQNQTKLPNSARRLEVLRQCIGSIFENRLADAKKTFPGILYFMNYSITYIGTSKSGPGIIHFYVIYKIFEKWELKVHVLS